MVRRLFLALGERHSYTDGCRIDLTTPAPDKIKVNEIINANPRGNQGQQRSQQDCPAVLSQHLETQQINIAGELPVAAGFAPQLSIPSSKPGEEFFFVSGPGNLGISCANRREGLGVA